MNVSRDIELNNVQQPEEKINFSQDILDLASQLIYDASIGRITNFERTADCLKFYRIYLSKLFQLIRLFFHLTLVVLLFFDTTNRNSRSLSSKITVTIESICLGFYSCQLFIIYKFSKKEIFFRDKKHYITASAILVSIVDIMLFMNSIYKFRISPFLRVLLFINSAEQSQIRRHLRTLRMTTIDVLFILPFILTFYLMMVTFTYRYFQNNKSGLFYYYNGDPYMQNLREIVWETLVFVTSANSPDVMLPALSKSPIVGILFLIFYAVMYFLLIFIYGLLIGHFRKYAEREMYFHITQKKLIVYDAFILLSEKILIEEDQQMVSKNVIKIEKFELLFQKLKKFKNNKEASTLIYSLLCDSNKTYLAKKEFMLIADILSVPLNMVSGSLHFFEKHLWFGFSNRLADSIECKLFSYIVGVLIIVNSICITFANEPYLELFFSILFIIEIFLRIYVKGIIRYFKSLWNIFDFFVIMLAFAFWFVENEKLNTQTITFTLLVLRNLRLLKLLRGIETYYKLLHTFGILIPTIGSLLTMVFCVMVLFVCIGIWLYQGLFYSTYSESDYMQNLTNCNSSNLENSEFGRLHYCILSFNSFFAGFETLSSVAIGNNWHVITQGYELESKHVILTRLYFSTYKGIMTYLLLLIVAFILDIFLIAHTKNGTLKIEDVMNKKLKDLDLNFKSYKNIRDSRNVLTHSPPNSNSFSILHYFKVVKFDESKSNSVWFRIKSKGAKSVEYISQAIFQSGIEDKLKLEMEFKHLYDVE